MRRIVTFKLKDQRGKTQRVVKREIEGFSLTDIDAQAEDQGFSLMGLYNRPLVEYRTRRAVPDIARAVARRFQAVLRSTL